MIKYINLSHFTVTHLQKCDYVTREFSCGEFEFYLNEKVNGCDVMIWQSFERRKFNDGLIKLQLVCETLIRNGVKTISYFAPFIPYLRQDKSGEGNGLAVKMIGEIMNKCHIKEIITYDIHSLRLCDFFSGIVNNFSLIPAFIKEIENNFSLEEVCIILPDDGALNRFQYLQEKGGFQTGFIDKKRHEGGLSTQISANVKGKICIIIDDMIDTGLTVIEAAKHLTQLQALEVIVYASHGIFSGDVIDKIEKSPIKKVVISNSLINDFPSLKVGVRQIW